MTFEPRLLYAATLVRGYDRSGNPNPGAQYGQTILRNILKDHPDSAAANHYWIHPVESSNHPEWAIESAERLGRLAPNSSHLVHMPGHIFYRIGDYSRARQIFLDALQIDREYMAKQHVDVRDDWNYSHNIAYLIADCAEAGRYREARDYVRLLAGAADDPDQSGAASFYVVQIASAAARLAIRFSDWDTAIREPLAFGVSDDKLSVWIRDYRDGLLAYARGMKAGESNLLAEADREATLLDALLWRLSHEELPDGDASHSQVVKILSAASFELRGSLASYNGDIDSARHLLDQAAESEKQIGYSEPPRYSSPVAETLGNVLIRAGKFEEAREAFRKALDERPHSGFALYGIALAWEKQGNPDEAFKGRGSSPSERIFLLGRRYLVELGGMDEFSQPLSGYHYPHIAWPHHAGKRHKRADDGQLDARRAGANGDLHADILGFGYLSDGQGY